MRAGTVSGAARLLHISQPAVTKVLQHAEAQLGLALFERVKGKFHPTPEARRLFVEVDKLHGELASVRRLAESLRLGTAQRVRLSVTPALGLTVVPRAVAQWSVAVKDSACDLATQHSRELVHGLLVSEVDLGLTLQDPQHPGVVAETLVTAPLMALVPARGAALRQRAPVRLQDLPQEPIGLSAHDPLGHRLQAECEALQLQWRPRITVQTYPLARELAEAGVGVALVDPYTAADADLTRVAVRPIDPPIPIPLVTLTPAAAPLSQAARRLVEALRASAIDTLASAHIIPMAPSGPGAHAPLGDEG